MLKFLSRKQSSEDATVEMTKLIMEIQESLTSCVNQAEMFCRAAYYDSSSAHIPFKSLKDGGNRNTIGANAEEFKQIMQGQE